MLAVQSNNTGFWVVATILLTAFALRFIIYLAQWASYKDRYNRVHDGRPKAHYPELKKPTLLFHSKKAKK